MNTATGQSNLNISETKELDSVRFIQFHSLNGDDASCLNLNQAQHPRIIAVNTYEFNSRHAFSFATLLPTISKNEVWKELEKKYDTQFSDVYQALNYLLERGKQDIDQKQRKRIGY